MLPDREIVLVYGKTGMGKTRWTRRFLAPRQRVMISDPMLEYDGLLFDDLVAMTEHVTHYRTWRVKTMHLEDFPFLCAAAYTVGRCTLAVEESQGLYVVRPQAAMPRDFENIVYRGRHRGVSLVMVSQRPTTVNIAARSQWTRLVTFRQTEGADLKWLEDQTGWDAEQFFNLKPGEYIESTAYGSAQKVLADQWPME